MTRQDHIAALLNRAALIHKTGAYRSYSIGQLTSYVRYLELGKRLISGAPDAIQRLYASYISETIKRYKELSHV